MIPWGKLGATRGIAAEAKCIAYGRNLRSALGEAMKYVRENKNSRTLLYLTQEQELVAREMLREKLEHTREAGEGNP